MKDKEKRPGQRKRLMDQTLVVRDFTVFSPLHDVILHVASCHCKVSFTSATAEDIYICAKVLAFVS